MNKKSNTLSIAFLLPVKNVARLDLHKLESKQLRKAAVLRLLFRSNPSLLHRFSVLPAAI